MTVTEFLLARFNEDEAWAREASDPIAVLWDIVSEMRDPGPADPARVLAEVEAKLRIVELANAAPGGYRAMMTEALCALALPYSDHPDYQQEWKP